MFAQLTRWFSPSSDIMRAHAIYIALVGQARQPFFYASLGVPDTLDGRFDMIILHLSLFIERMKTDDAQPAPALSATVLECFIQDMDRSLREMGIGDTGVAKRVKKMADALNGRLSTYAACEDEAALSEALRRNVYGTLNDISEDQLAQLTRYMIEARANLAAQSTPEITTANFHFPVI